MRSLVARWLLGLSMATALVHACAAALQPVWAGLYLSARYEMLGVHYLGANAVYYAALVQLALALALWATSRRRGWFVLASVAIVAAETLQFVTGIDGDLAVHVPLGVAIVGAALTSTAVLCATVSRPRPATGEDRS